MSREGDLFGGGAATTMNKLVLSQANLYSALMKKILIAWIGKTDLRAPIESAGLDLGPIAQARLWQPFDAL